MCGKCVRVCVCARERECEREQYRFVKRKSICQKFLIFRDKKELLVGFILFNINKSTRRNQHCLISKKVSPVPCLSFEDFMFSYWIC